MQNKFYKIYKQNRIILLASLVIAASWVFLFSITVATRGQDGFFTNDIIRLHIIANDDSEKEQELKISLRDGLLLYIQEIIEPASNVSQALRLLYGNLDKIEAKSQRILQETESLHNATALLKNNLVFPAMAYGTLILPRGNYSALQIIVGEGDGKNWWCIMFPSMCLTEATPKVLESYELSERQRLALQNGEIVTRPRFRLLDIFR